MAPHPFKSIWGAVFLGLFGFPNRKVTCSPPAPGRVLVFLLQVIDPTGILENPIRGSGCRQFLIPEAR